LAERLCWEVACRDDARIARRLYRKQVVDGVYRLDVGALLDDFFSFLQAIGVMALLEQVHGAGIQREMVPFVQYVLLYGVKTLFGIKSINALPSLLFSDEALMQLVGFNATRYVPGCASAGGQAPAARSPGRFAQTPWQNMVKCNLRSSKPCSTGPFAVARPEFRRGSPALPMARI
jgi:hypothetical protein